MALTKRGVIPVCGIPFHATNGALDVRLDDVTVKGKPLPGMLFSEFKKQNLAQNFQNEPQTATNLARLDSIQITNGTVILRNKLSLP